MRTSTRHTVLPLEGDASINSNMLGIYLRQTSPPQQQRDCLLRSTSPTGASHETSTSPHTTPQAK